MSNSFNIKGKLHKKYDTEQKTATFSAREFVIEVNDNNYMNYIKFQLTQDRCSLIDPINEQDDLIVHFDLRGREWQGKYFTNLNAWKIEAASASNESFGSGTDTDVPFPEVEVGTSDVDQSLPEMDDLPF